MKKGILTLLSIFVIAHSAFAGYGSANRGLLIHRTFVEDNDADTITVTTGYGDSNGNYFEITSEMSHDMTSLALGEDFHYIYIDDSASAYPAVTIIDAVGEPAWSDAKQGWYNGNDRCIGVVYSESGSATVVEFLHEDGFIRNTADVSLGSAMDPNSTWQIPDDANTDTKTPVNATKALIWIQNADDNSFVFLGITTKELAENGAGTVHAQSIAQASSWNKLGFAQVIPLGASREIRVHGEGNDSNELYVKLYGYQISR